MKLKFIIVLTILVSALSLCSSAVCYAPNCYACQTNNSNLCSSGNCYPGFWNYNGNCVLCGLGCSSCSNSTTCKVCKNGYFLSNGQCLQVCNVRNCSNCVAGNPNVCASCSYGFLYSNGQCITPCNANNCLSCQANSSSLCSQCKPNFLNNYGQCVPACVVPYCYQCVAGNPNSCLTCVNNFQNYGSRCASTLYNCAEIGYFPTFNEYRCNRCLSGFYAYNGFCQSKCDRSSCSTCTNVLLAGGVYEWRCTKCSGLLSFVNSYGFCSALGLREESFEDITERAKKGEKEIKKEESKEKNEVKIEKKELKTEIVKEENKQLKPEIVKEEKKEVKRMSFY